MAAGGVGAVARVGVGDLLSLCLQSQEQNEQKWDCDMKSPGPLSRAHSSVRLRLLTVPQASQKHARWGPSVPICAPVGLFHLQTITLAYQKKQRSLFYFGNEDGPRGSRDKGLKLTGW